MKTHFRNFAFVFPALVVFLFIQNEVVAQQNPFSFNSQSNSDDIVLTWNKNTPETEMKDDVKALAEKGITIKYSNVKRNNKEEITGIKVEYSDRKGNKGKLELENVNPIANIKFFKQSETIGFGEPSNGNDFFGGNPMMNGFANADDIMKQFKFNRNDGDSQSFSFSLPNDGATSKSQIRIQKEGKKPLVIEDGEIVEGGDDYTKEELEEIKKNNKFEGSKSNNKNEFDFRNSEGLENFKNQMEKMQGDLNKTESNSKEEFDKTKLEMLKAKEEMIKAREELENAKKELGKSKTKLKSQKA